MESVEKSGGVKVILGFIPQSNRNKLQIQGRTARQANKGMFQFVVNLKDAHQEFVSCYMQAGCKFNKGLEIYMKNCLKTDQEKRQENREMFTFFHGTCSKFFKPSLGELNRYQREEAVERWQYFFTRIRWAQWKKNQLDQLEEELNKFIQQNDNLF
eukprot:TRINITY_DN1464_c0_g1_i1.p1 TRINITY_DN1464_c0_g1~~TRINITY_DN1464_c0_g1_i1.p1  ORF type:complete len:156 (+),score=24.20 TRINITY_DN1464_c0_g1_i1:529-996(+)